MIWILTGIILGSLILWWWYEMRHAGVCPTCHGRGTVWTEDGNAKGCPSCSMEWKLRTYV